VSFVRKFLSVLLALVLTISFSSVAFALNIPEDEDIDWAEGKVIFRGQEVYRDSLTAEELAEAFGYDRINWQLMEEIGAANPANGMRTQDVGVSSSGLFPNIEQLYGDKIDAQLMRPGVRERLKQDLIRAAQVHGPVGNYFDPGVQAPYEGGIMMLDLMRDIALRLGFTDSTMTEI